MIKKYDSTVINTTKFLSKIACIFGICVFQAQSNFPYDPIPLTDGAFEVTLDVNTLEGTRTFNNLLLGSNVDFNTSVARVQLSWAPLLAADGTVVNGNAPNQGFNSLEGQQFIADNDPVVLRFPQGVFANTYHWERVLDENGEELAAADSRHIIDPFVIGTRIISKHDSPKTVRIGYPSLKKIFDTASTLDKPLDLLTVLSIVGNDADANGRRWSAMIADGLNVTDMELGNEFFWRSQRSGTINTEEQWVSRAREIVANIKTRAAALDKTVRFAIPVSYRTSHQNFNDLITVDESFFDAIVVHRYVSAQRDSGTKPEDLTVKSIRDVLSASIIMDESLTYCKAQVSDSKDAIWLTEWGVSASENGGVAASFLGAADVYSHIITNNNRLEVERINWFSTVGANAQYTVNGSRSNPRIGTTGYGDVYRLLRNSLRDSELFNQVELTAPDLKLNEEVQDAKPIHVLAVNRAGNKPRFIVTNKTNETARIFVNTDGNNQNTINYIATGVRWESLIATTSLPYSNEQTSVTSILIPPYAIVNIDASFGEGVSVLSVDEVANTNKDAEILVYPNPTSSTVTIDLKKIQTANVKVFDVLGKVVFYKNTHKTSVQLETKTIFKKGVYFVTVTDINNKTYFKKLIVN